MARSFVAYGLLANGNYGVLLDPATRKPLAAASEVLPTLPTVASTDNYEGRLVFSLANSTLYVYVTFPTPAWKPLDGIPASVGNVAGNPPVIPLPQSGSLFWDLDTEVLFVFDGGAWQPAGGRYAAQIIENNYVGNGVLTNFATGAAVAIQSEYAEVFLDGVRQIAGSDYNVVGTLVSFTSAPPTGVVIHIRALVSDAIVQTATVTRASYIATAAQTIFSTGQPGSNPAGIFVFANGLVQVQNIDYNLLQQNTQINTLTKIGPTTARAVTAAAHGIPIGAPVTLVNFLEPEYNNHTVIVTAAPTTTSFDFTVLPTDPASGTPNLIASFSPPYVNDRVQFLVGRTAGDEIDIRSLRNVVVSGNVGEVNTLASAGVGVSLATTKIGTTLQTKSLVQGANVIITDLGSEVQIAANVGQGYEDRVGINAGTYNVTGTTSYIGVRNTTTPVTINLATIAQLPVNSGRRVVVMDESGGANTNQISVVAGAASINGSAAPYIINTAYGSATFVFDGNDWYVTASRP